MDEMLHHLLKRWNDDYLVKPNKQNTWFSMVASRRETEFVHPTGWPKDPNTSSARSLLQLLGDPPALIAAENHGPKTWPRRCVKHTAHKIAVNIYKSNVR